MKSRLPTVLGLLTVAFALAAVSTPSTAGSGEQWVVSIPRIDTKEVPVAGLPEPRRESIVGFKVTLTAGAVASIPEVPIGWNCVIDNDPSWNTTLTATVIVAAAALEPAYFSKGFVTVSKARPLVGQLESERKFDVHVEVALSADFEHERRLNFGPQDLVLTKVPQ